MSQGAAVSDRLRALRALGAAEPAPLWIEALPSEEALTELSGRQGPVFDLQRARFLAELGRPAEAAAILERTGDLPVGLAAVRDRLRESLSQGAVGSAASEREVLRASAARLEQWLERVNRWRSELRV